MTAGGSARTYEELRDKIALLQPAGEDERRSLVWCSDAQLLAATRGVHGELEILVIGPRLVSENALVREILDYDTWKRVDGSTITASRIVLPPAEPFDAITAFLCTELLRNNVDADPQQALRASEPIIETVLQRSLMQTDSVVGLTGELLVILQLLRSDPKSLRRVLRSWHGPTRAARDLQLGGVGVEVKTTRGSTSSHHVEGVRQVEVGHGVGGVAESFLYLVSIGLEPAERGAGHTVPGLVDSILDEIRRGAGRDADETGEQFLADVASYGLASDAGYDHRRMRDRAVFSQSWSIAFCRTYDMSDPAVLVLRTPDISHRTMVELDTVAFRIKLPDQVAGDTNPSAGLPAMATRILAAVG